MSPVPTWFQDLKTAMAGRRFLGVSQLESLLPVDLGVETLEEVQEWLAGEQILLVDETRRRPVGYFPRWYPDLWEVVGPEVEGAADLGDRDPGARERAHRFLLGIDEDASGTAGYQEDDPDEPLEDPWTSYLELAREQDRLDPEEEELLARRALEGDGEARSALLASFLGRVVFMARRYTKAGAQQDDLIQAGNLALVEALESYRPDSPRSFSWHAERFVRRAFGRHLAEDRRSIRLPRSADKMIRKLLATHERICKEKSRIPTHEELGEALSIPVEEVGTYMSYLQAPLSMEAPSSPGETLKLEETIEDEQAPSPAEWGARIGLLERLEELLEDHSVSHRRVVALRYGLLDGVSYTRSEVGRKTGLSETEIQRLETEALEALREIQGLEGLL